VSSSSGESSNGSLPQELATSAVTAPAAVT
jgi:hypothetical protein